MSTSAITSTVSSALQNSVSNTTTDKTSDSSTTTATSDSQVATTSDVELSTRAQKIQALSEEFFPGGPDTIVITDAFIERLKEYGLISSDDAQTLTASLGSTTDAESTIPLDTLATEVKSLISYLEEQQAEEETIDTLNSALAVIENFDSFSSNTTELNTLLNEVDVIQAAASEQGFSQAQQTTLDDLDTALSIATKLSPDSVTADKVNHYLEVLKL